MTNLKSKIRIADYCNAKIYKKVKNGRLLKDCPFCNNKWHFRLNDNNSYCSYNGCCQGGDSIDFMREKFGKSYNDLLSEYNIDYKPKKQDKTDKIFEEIEKQLNDYYIDKYYDLLNEKFTDERFIEGLKYIDSFNTKYEKAIMARQVIDKLVDM